MVTPGFNRLLVVRGGVFACFAIIFGVSSLLVPTSASALVWHTWDTGAGGNGHQYALLDEYLSWTTANSVAGLLGAHLVTISNAYEERFLESTFNVYGPSGYPEYVYWIGLTDNEDYGGHESNGSPTDGWRWVTGEALTYTNWSSGAPKNGVNDYVTIAWAQGNGWKDLPNEWTMPDSRAMGGYSLLERGIGTPEPSLGLLLLVGVVPLGIAVRRRKRNGAGV